MNWWHQVCNFVHDFILLELCTKGTITQFIVLHWMCFINLFFVTYLLICVCVQVRNRRRISTQTIDLEWVLNTSCLSTTVTNDYCDAVCSVWCLICEFLFLSFCISTGNQNNSNSPNDGNQLEPMNVCSYPRKLIPSKIYPQSIVTMKICAFMVHINLTVIAI